MYVNESAGQVGQLHEPCDGWWRHALRLVSLLALLLVGCAEPAQGAVREAVAGLAAALSEGAGETAAALTPRCVRRGAAVLERRGVRGASGPLALAVWDGRAVALVADEDEDALHVIDTAAMRLLSTLELPGTPGHVIVLADGRVALTLRYHNRLLLLEPALRPEDGLSQLCLGQVAQEPIALSEHQDELLVLSGFGAALSRLRSRDLSLIEVVPLGREPRGLLISANGKAAWISHMTGGLVSHIELARSRRTEHRVNRARAADDSISRGSQGFAIASYRSLDGHERLLVPMVSSLSPRMRDNTSIGYGGSALDDRLFEPWVASIDTNAEDLLASGSAPRSDWPTTCMLPRAALVDSERLYLACLDQGTVLELDARALDPMMAVRRRYQLGEGANGLALADGQLFVWSLFSHQLARVPTSIEATNKAAAQPIALTRLALPRRLNSRWTAERREGRSLFHLTGDQRISANGATCESCHPDGRDDGLVWGVGTSTMFLAGRLEGGEPFGWHGEHGSLFERVQATAQRLGGLGFNRAADKVKAERLMDYMRTLRPPPAPLPQSPDEQAQIARGETIFSDTLSCSACHPRGAANGSKLQIDGQKLDTPSLHYVAQSGPFFHDNRYETLDALLADPAQPMDATGQLNATGRADLVAYLRSLPFGPVNEAPALAGQGEVRTAATTGWRVAADEQLSGKLAVSSGLVSTGSIGSAQSFDIDTIPSVTMPFAREQELKVEQAWTSGRAKRGELIIPENRYGSASVTDEDSLETSVLTHFIVSNHAEPILEIQGCRPHGLPTWAWGNTRDHTVRCPKETRKVRLASLGGYGFAARTRRGDTEVLLLVVPRAGSDYQAGAVRKQGRGSVSVFSLTLAPGISSELHVRSLTDAKWQRAGFSPLTGDALLSVVWPADAAKPQILIVPR